jgi:hypothetical protein
MSNEERYRHLMQDAMYVATAMLQEVYPKEHVQEAIIVVRYSTACHDRALLLNAAEEAGFIIIGIMAAPLAFAIGVAHDLDLCVDTKVLVVHADEDVYEVSAVKLSKMGGGLLGDAVELEVERSWSTSDRAEVQKLLWAAGVEYACLVGDKAFQAPEQTIKIVDAPGDDASRGGAIYIVSTLSDNNGRPCKFLVRHKLCSSLGVTYGDGDVRILRQRDGPVPFEAKFSVPHGLVPCIVELTDEDAEEMVPLCDIRLSRKQHAAAAAAAVGDSQTEIVLTVDCSGTISGVTASDSFDVALCSSVRHKTMPSLRPMQVGSAACAYSRVSVICALQSVRAGSTQVSHWFTVHRTPSRSSTACASSARHSRRQSES